jgi:tRNA threonylcarbamoyladenosine biosynthesis protein TsaE
MNKTWICKSEIELGDIAKDLVAEFNSDRIFAFYGSMGAGKTTFIKHICEALEVLDIVNSPTFAILNEYESPSNGDVYHFDFYRIKKEEEAMDIGFDDYVYSGNFCLIEWPELIDNLLPEKFVKVEIEVNEADASRSISATAL